MIVGTEWLVEAAGCDAARLRDDATLKTVFDKLLADLDLKAVQTVWHKFPGEGGVTGIALLTESHLACHTYPEYGVATFNLYCCRERREWEWESELKAALGARSVNVSRVERGIGAARVAAPGESG
jgi:S-adenosylmethionine decarboxylase